MIEGVALFYGLLASFVLSSTHRNRAANRAHPKTVLYFGWALMGGSFGGSALLFLTATRLWLLG